MRQVDGRVEHVGSRLFAGGIQKHTPGLREETGGVLQMDSVTPVRRADYIVFIFRTIASAIWRVPTAVGSLRSAFMS